MKLMRLFIGILGLLVMIPACHKTETEHVPAETTQEVADKAAQKAASDAEAKARRDEIAQKLRAADDATPPRVMLSFETVKVSDNITFQDAETSYHFIKAGLSRCYVFAYADDHNAKGFVTLSAHREGQNKAVATEISSEIKVKDFEKCLREVTPQWLMPPNSSVTTRIHFEARPGLTTEEIRKLSPDHRH